MEAKTASKNLLEKIRKVSQSSVNEFGRSLNLLLSTSFKKPKQFKSQDKFGQFGPFGPFGKFGGQPAESFKRANDNCPMIVVQ